MFGFKWEIRDEDEYEIFLFCSSVGQPSWDITVIVSNGRGWSDYRGAQPSDGNSRLESAGGQKPLITRFSSARAKALALFCLFFVVPRLLSTHYRRLSFVLRLDERLAILVFMGNLAVFLPYIQISLAVLTSIGILLQRSEAGMGSAFGDFDAGSKITRRGFEKFLFNATITLGILFTLSVFVDLII